MTADKRRRERQLSEQERHLWAEVAKTVSPIESDGHRDTQVVSAQPNATAEPAADAERRKSPGRAKKAAAASPVKPTGPAVKRARTDQPKLQPFEDKKARRLARQTLEIDAVLDLHGMRQREAHGALVSFLGSAQASGHRYVKVITGKGVVIPDDGRSPGRSASSEHPEDLWHSHVGAERGVLRRMVPKWLEEAECRRFVVSYTSAGRVHGGDGALYIHVKRRAPTGD